MDLTPQQLHYFKRELISLQIRQELDKLKRDPELSAVLQPNVGGDYPFLQYIAQKFVVDFPLLKRGSHDDFWKRCQDFLNELSKVKLDTYTPRKTGASQRRILAYKIEKLMTVGLCAAVKTAQGQEQAIHVRPGQEDDKENQPADKLATSIEQDLTLLENDDHYLEWLGFSGLDINVVTVRTISEKRTLREKTHAEFILETSKQDQPPVHVARRHGQFRQLCLDLRAAFPTEEVPSPPSKASDPSYDGNTSHFHRRPSDPASHLYREKDRLLLRSFLHRVAAQPKLARSEIFERFLFQDPIELTEAQKADVEKRRTFDHARREEEERFKEQVDQRMSELDDLLAMLKKKILQPGGLLEVFDTIKSTDRIENLPEPLRKAFEWGRINFAFVLHTQFVTSDRASENIANLKRTHSLMPYRAIAQLLKLSNPFAMVKGILDLFLMQPLGRRSLFQRIIMANMNDEVKEYQSDITALEAEIGDAILCKKVQNAVETPILEDVELSSLSSTQETLEILRNSDIEPALTPDQIKKIAYAAEDAEQRKLVKQLHRLWTLYAQKREHELLMGLVFQGATGEMLREIFAIFYQPLAEVYKAANIGDSMQQLSAFLDDLITLVDSLNAQDVRNTAQPFIDLVQRHEQNFYTFVHSVHKNDTSHLFDELLKYVDGCFSLISNGLPGRVDLDQTVEAAGITPEQKAELRQDIDAICSYHRERKAQHVRRTRQKLIMGQDEGVEDEALNFWPNRTEMLGVMNDLAELQADDDESSDDESSSSSNTSSQVAHELTIQKPQLKVLPLVVPLFTAAAAELMAAQEPPSA